MPNDIAKRPDAGAIEQVLIGGDLSKLYSDQRLAYYKNVCESVGLNPLTKPFDYLTLNSKLVLYAKRDATDQLRKIHGVSLRITARDNIEGVYIVTAQATDKTGRVDESTGAVNIASLKGDNLANALMKAETKAKRRVTLSICGLGMLDETEIETIPVATVEPLQEPPKSEEKPLRKLAEVIPPSPPSKDWTKEARAIYRKMKNAEDQDGRNFILADHKDDLAEIAKADPKAHKAIMDISLGSKEAA